MQLAGIFAHAGTIAFLGTSAWADDIRSSGQRHSDFLNPPAVQRPRFRYWLPDGSVDPDVVKSDIRSVGGIGAGGVEFLPFYNYGGGLGPPPAGVNWSTNGFGTPAHLRLFAAALEAHNESGLAMDFSLGPNQGQGVPAEPDTEGLQWDLFAETQLVPAGGRLNGTVPGWGTGELVAAVSSVVVARTNVSYNVSGVQGPTTVSYQDLILDSESLEDITSSISKRGDLSTDSHGHGVSSERQLFFFYQKLSGEKNLHFDSNKTETIWDRGSYTVDHFSSKGAETIRDFWERHMFVDGVRELLLGGVGNYGWEDSLEIRSTISWTTGLPDRFECMFGYDLRKYLPLVMFRNNNINLQNTEPGKMRCVLNTPDGGQGYVNDYRAALAEGYQEYLSSLSEWLRSLGLQLSSQVSYNMPMDMEASIPYVDAPECESLQFADNVDGYRQFSGPANLAGKNVISNELGAIFGKAYRFTIPELLFSMNRAVAGGVNQFVIHGLSYSGDYPQTTWPGYTAFRYAVSDMFSPKRPDWGHGLGAALDYMARIQHVQQTGMPRTDVAFFNKQSVTDPNAGTIYQPKDLVSEGWSYTYLSPDNFDLPHAVVRDKILAPDGPRFQAMVVLGSQNLTDSGIRRLTEFAGDGLPLIIAGGTPGRFPSNSLTADPSAFEASLADLLQHENVYQVAEGKISETLTSLHLTPRVAVRTNGTWYTTWREDRKAGVSYAYVFCDIEPASGEVLVESTGIPYFFDAWTGERKPVLNYRKDGNKTIIPLELAGSQTRIIAFSEEPLDGIEIPDFFATELPTNVLGYTANGNEAVLHLASSSRLTEVVLSSGSRICHHSKAPESFELGPWELVLEHWEAPKDMRDVSAVASKRNSTHQLDKLVSWTEIPAATNSSGLGYYSANFTWPASLTTDFNTTTMGAYIVFPAVLNAVAVTVNGAHLPPLDYTRPIADLAPHLVEGENHIVAVVPSTMWNYIRSILPDIENAGLNHLTNFGPGAESKTENGLVGSVRIVPYEVLRVGTSEGDGGCAGNA